MKKTIAVIPARGGSKRFPRKNIAPLLGVPLIHYPIQATSKSGVFDEIYVSTEDDEIAAVAKQEGATIHDRKHEYATDTAHELDACYDVLLSIEQEQGAMPNYMCVIYPTAILIEPQDFINSKEIFNAHPDTEAIMCVSEYNYHPYKSLITNEQGHLEMMYPVECKQRSQTYPHVVASNGTLYWLHVDTFIKNRQKSYYQDILRPYIIPYDRAVDIDYPQDLDYAERLMKLKHENERHKIKEI